MVAREARRSAASAEQQAQKTFSEAAAQYIAQHEMSWKNSKHQAQWTATLRTYAEPSLGRLFVRDIRAAHVIGVLEPIWTTKTGTASRVRSRIELCARLRRGARLSARPQSRALERGMLARRAAQRFQGGSRAPSRGCRGERGRVLHEDAGDRKKGIGRAAA